LSDIAVTKSLTLVYTTSMSTQEQQHTPAKHHHSVKIVRHVVPVPIEPIAPPVKTQTDRFRKISQKVTNRLGSPWAFLVAALLVLVWLLTGPLFDFSDTWQLVINTGTTIVTFLMVFAIQNTQNRDGRAVQLKLNELIKASRGARTEFVDLEDLTDTELDTIQIQFKEIHDKLIDKQNKVAK
jgi:low affinity Fe/Cu permease